VSYQWYRLRYEDRMGYKSERYLLNKQIGQDTVLAVRINTSLMANLETSSESWDETGLLRIYFCTNCIDLAVQTEFFCLMRERKNRATCCLLKLRAHPTEPKNRSSYQSFPDFDNSINNLPQYLKYNIVDLLYKQETGYEQILY